MIKLLNLFDIIRDIPRDRVFLNDDLGSLTYGELVDRSYQFEESNPGLQGKSCAVVSESKKALAVALPALSKICKTLYLQPNDFEDEFADKLYNEIGIDFKIRVTENQLIISALNGNPAKADNALFMLSTSGTTGLPKVFAYSIDRLMHKAKVDIRRGEEFNWALAYDLNRFAGLQVYLQALASGSSITPLRFCQGFAEQVATCHKHGVNAISATPSFWRQFMMVPNASDLDLKIITLGGEIADQSIISVLSRTFANSKVAHIYASTEAGVGFSVRDKKAGFSIDEIHQQYPDISLKIINDLLYIKSHSSAESIISGNLEVTADGYINTGDLVEKKGNRYYFLGRKSGIINVGGNKVLPEVIESVLNQDCEVKISKVYPKKSSILSALVCADVVLTSNAVEHVSLKRRLKELCKEQLPSYMVPAFIKVVEEIQITSTGKVVRDGE